ncbi:cytochrome c3 family protein [Raoultibacter phocaeensis]|uniref:cytochrome c3 family protein n=1 Tax=Raoultibacter phocaeensis TaxID=2479841 RepID=UPI0011184498|nr:cytochrome c3 family protein [Raoultibacter phocaeensis]
MIVMRGDAKGKPKILVAAGFASCLLVAAGLLGCQPPSPGETLMPGISAAEDISSQEEFTWSQDLECAPCHTPEAQSAADSACTSFSSARSRCLTCHDDAQKLTEAHEDMRNAKPPAKAERTIVESEACMSCHDTGSLAEKTIDSTALTDSYRATINPHALPENESHSKIDCTACHTMHGSANASEMAPEACQSCHHADIYDCERCH